MFRYLLTSSSAEAPRQRTQPKSFKFVDLGPNSTDSEIRLHQNSGQYLTDVWGNNELYPRAYSDAGWIYRHYVCAPWHILEKMGLDPQSTEFHGPFSRTDDPRRHRRLLENRDFRVQSLTLRERYSQLHGLTERLCNLPQYYNEILDSSRFSSQKPNRSFFNLWEGLFTNATSAGGAMPDYLVANVLFRAANGRLLPNQSFRCDIVETVLSCPTEYYLKYPERFTIAQHMAIKHAVYRALHDLKVSYNYKLLEGRASHLATCPGPVPLDERLIFLKLDAHDSVGQIMATMYPRLVPLNQRLIIRALRQWDAVSAWFTGAVDAVQGPVLLRWLGLAGSDYLGRRFKAEETGVSKAVGGCSFPTRPQAMPLNVQYLPELTDYLRLCDAMCSWPPGLYSCVHFWVHFVPHFNLSLRWFLKVAALYTIPWYGVAVIAIVVSSLFVGATVLLALSFWRGFSLIHTAVLLEVSGASVVALAAIVGLAWYDPSGQVLALLLLMVSACEFALWAACAVRARWGRSDYRRGGSFMWLTVAVGSDVTPAANGGLVGLLLGWIVAGVLAGVAVSVAASGLSYYLLAREKDMWSKGVWSNDWTDLDEALVPDGYTSVQDAVLRELDMWVSTMWPEFLVSWWPDRLWMLATPVPGQAGGELLPLFVLLCSVVVTVFALWLSLVSNRWYRSDFMALGSNYECGAEPLGERISAGDVLSFFKIVCVFLVFEWEWVLLFVAVPLLGVCGRAAVLVLSAFILLVELGVLAELRSGSSLFTKTK